MEPAASTSVFSPTMNFRFCGLFPPLPGRRQGQQWVESRNSNWPTTLLSTCNSSRRERGWRLSPLRGTKREAGGRAPDGEPSRPPSRKAHQHFLDFPKKQSNDLVSRKMVHSAMVAPFRQSDGHKNAGRRRPKKKSGASGEDPEIEDNPLKRRTSRKERDLRY